MPWMKEHDDRLSDAAWRLLEPPLPGQSGPLGRRCARQSPFSRRCLVDLRTGAPWRDLPASYGDWKNTHRRFCRWRDRGIWERLLEQLIDEPDMASLMIDASHCKVHPHAAGARGGNAGMSRTKGGSTPRYIRPLMRRVCQSESLLQKLPARTVAWLAHSSQGLPPGT